MAKNTQKNNENAAPKNEVELNSTPIFVRAIKNTLFADLPVGSEIVVAGTIKSYTTESGTYGEYSKFKGDFALKTPSAIFTALTLFVPQIADEYLKSAFDTVNKDIVGEEKEKSVDFGFKLVKTDDSANKRNKAGYAWAIKPVRENVESSKRVLALLEG